MEAVLTKINEKYIRLPDIETKIYKKIKSHVEEKVKEELLKDETFNGLFERFFYGGSFYDDLKVGKAEEYDLDFVFNLPVCIKPKIEVSDKHGFVYCKIHDFASMLKRPEKDKFLKLYDFLDSENYLSTTKVFSWLQGVLQKVKTNLDGTNDKNEFVISLSETETATFHTTWSIKAPAFTVNISGVHNGREMKMDVDFVPCFQFLCQTDWPGSPYRKNPITNRDKFLIVPKKPTNVDKNIDRYWRLSFQEQERELFKDDYRAFKPTLKLIKKLRDQQNHSKIASYFIKTLFLWQLEATDKKYWHKPLADVFMDMLKKYKEALDGKKIPYYWNKKFNLLENVRSDTLAGWANQINRIINNIEKSEDALIVANYLLTSSEVAEIKLSLGNVKKVALGNVKKVCASPQNNNPVPFAQLLDTESNLFNNPLTFSPSFKNINVAPPTSLDFKMEKILEKLDMVLSKVDNIDRRLKVIEDHVKPPQVNNENNIIDDLLSFRSLTLTPTNINNM
ncbi:cyclic GMP-AMP synthase-like receptor [Aethina tumida]|uniref:cyclic GMP-AMP synthase-like receptor n=1 Tax=Aethina tumida TaxID=116153 RepID=UPI0021488BBD|nr:cyclic GMP-AMP synthase-like receptor [Aethina tumida]